MARNLQGWTWMWMRQRLASEYGPSPDTVVKACGKKIVLRWSKCVRLEKARSICLVFRKFTVRSVAYEAWQV